MYLVPKNLTIDNFISLTTSSDLQLYDLDSGEERKRVFSWSPTAGESDQVAGKAARQTRLSQMCNEGALGLSDWGSYLEVEHAAVSLWKMNIVFGAYKLKVTRGQEQSLGGHHPQHDNNSLSSVGEMLTVQEQ